MDKEYEHVAKLLGEIIRAFCRQYGVDHVEAFIRSIGTRPQFWMNARAICERKIPKIDVNNILRLPIDENPPQQGEKEE